MITRHTQLEWDIESIEDAIKTAKWELSRACSISDEEAIEDLIERLENQKQSLINAQEL
jgi:hypothetical protein